MPMPYITAAFRSSRENEAYIFMKNEYIREDYAPGGTNDKIFDGPKLIRHGFASLRGTTFAEIGIDCAFGSHDENEAFIFSGKLCANINYEEDKIIEGPATIAKRFPFFKGTVFEKGVDAAFESSKQFEAHLFKGDQYASINYGSPPQLIGAITPIKESWPCLRGTFFESGIDAAFAMHRKNWAYIFKEDSYVAFEFVQSTKPIGTPAKIKDYWSALGGLLPRKNHGIHIHSYKSKGYFHAAFRSSHIDEVYIFLKNEYMLLKYAPGTPHDKQLYGPVPISNGYASLKDTVFGDHGVDCAFGSHDIDEAFIFSGNICAKINFGPHSSNDKIIEGPMTISKMFPFFKGTVFESGVDAAFESSIPYEVYLFKGDQCARIYYGRNPYYIYILPTTDMFPSLTGTIFEYGLDAAFASHSEDEAYLFKGDSYARFNFSPGTSNDHLIGKVCKIKDSWSSLQPILPYKDYGEL